MRLATAIFLTLFHGVLHNLIAQGTVASGQRVRITSAQSGLEQQIGEVLAASGDSVTVRVERVRNEHYRQVARQDTLALSLASIDRLEISRHSGHRTARGALIGLGTGAALGLVVGAATYHECVPQGWFDCFMAPESATEQAFLGAIALGFIGTGIGAIAGAMTRSDKWEDVPTNRSSLSVRSLRGGGVGAGLTISF